MSKVIYQLPTEELDLPDWTNDIGSVYRLTGLVFNGEGKSYLAFTPEHNTADMPILYRFTYTEMQAILQVSDNPAFLENGKKPWIRKAQRVIGGFAQQRVWARDHFMCMYCGQSMGKVQLTVDHFFPLQSGGENVPTNYLSACRKCNKDKGALPPRQFCEENGYDFDGLLNWIDEKERTKGLVKFPKHLKIYRAEIRV